MNTTTTTKHIECPECGSAALLHTEGIWQGIWECENPECGASDTCEHTHIHQEDAEGPRYSADIDPEECQVNVCNDCGLTVREDL